MELRPQEGPQTKFVDTDCNIVFYGGGGGGGKTWCILFDNLRFVHDPNYFSVFFRKTTTELETNLWPEAVKMYSPFLKHQSGPKKGQWIGKARIRDKQKEIIFPSGAKTKFAFLELDKHADSYYGAELSRVYWDEFQQQSEYAFHVLRSRLRSKAKVKSQMRMTLNPDSAHFCYFWVKPFLDDEGFPVKELSGKIRYFLLVSGDLHSSWDKQELLDKFPNKKPQTYTYIPSTLEDNKILNEMEPEYRDTLDSMPPAKRKQLLLGCWAPSEDEGTLFQRGWLQKITKDKLPKNMTYCRGYDLAFNAPTENNKFPDYTYGILMGKSSDGFYYILGGHRLRESVGARNQLIINQMQKDISIWGDDITAVTAVDPAGGQVAFQEFNKQMIENRIKCKKDVIPNNKSKRVKYEPFSDACQNGLIYICEELFEPEELELLYKENELFDGVSRSTAHRKDDSCDSFGMTFNYLASKKTFKVFQLPTVNTTTKLSDMRSDI